MVLPILWAILSAVLQRRRGSCLASEASAILASAAGNFAQCLGNHCRGDLALALWPHPLGEALHQTGMWNPCCAIDFGTR
jgi:hypothetical protein